MVFNFIAVEKNLERKQKKCYFSLFLNLILDCCDYWQGLRVLSAKRELFTQNITPTIPRLRLEELEAEVSQYFNIRKNKSVNLTHSLLRLNPLVLLIIKAILENDFEFSTTHHAICLTKFRCKPLVAAAVVHFMTAR